MASRDNPSALAHERERIEDEVKREILDIFRELLDRLWGRLIALLGPAATAAIFRSVALEVGRAHPFVREIEADEAGLHLDGLAATLRGQERQAVRTGLLAYVDGIVGLLADLTGDVLLKKVGPIVDEFRKTLKDGSES